MVLEDATADARFQSEDEPPSDTDTFSGGQRVKGTNYTIDTSKLHKPVPILGPLMGRTEKNIARSATIGANAFNNVARRHAGRPMTNNEFQAMAEIYSRVDIMATYGTAVGIFIAGRQCGKGWKTYRLPLWQPNLSTFNPNEFGPFKGAVSRAIVHTIRATSYYGLGYFLGSYVGWQTGVISAFTSSRADERLKDLTKTMRDRLLEEAEQRRQSTTKPQHRQLPTTGDRSGNAASSATTSRWPSPPSKPSRDRAEDDMSPTSGSFYESYTSTSNSSDSEIWSDEQTATNRSRYSGSSGNDGRAAQSSQDFFESTTSSKPQQNPSSSWPGSRADSTQSSSSSSESAWDRIRRGASSGSQDDASLRGDAARPSQGGGNSSYDSFSFSSTDEDKSLAKAEAQRDFDARIERERQGKDFDSGERRGRW